MIACMAQGRTHSSGKPTFHSSQTRFDFVVKLLVEVFETEILYVVSTIRGKSLDRKWITNAFYRG